MLLHLAAVVAPPPTGTEPLRAIRLELRRIAAAASEPAGRPMLALLGEAQHDPVDLIYGPVFYRLLMGHAPATERFAMQALQRVLDGLAPDR